MNTTISPLIPDNLAATIHSYETEDQRWEAVLGRDRAADQIFFYGVRSTSIYCRPSCPSRRPSREPEQFHRLFEMSDAALAECGAKRCIADTKPGFPCRVSLEDAEVGEEVILIPFVQHDVASPYRASGPILVRAGVPQARLQVNEVPDSVRRRLLSLRAYDRYGSLIDAEVVGGQQIEILIERFFADNQVEYLHVHNARPGCYNCRVDRALQ